MNKQAQRQTPYTFTEQTGRLVQLMGFTQLILYLSIFFTFWLSSHDFTKTIESLPFFWPSLVLLSIASVVLVVFGRSLERHANNSTSNLLLLSTASVASALAMASILRVGVLVYLALLARLYAEYHLAKKK